MQDPTSRLAVSALFKRARLHGTNAEPGPEAIGNLRTPFGTNWMVPESQLAAAARCPQWGLATEHFCEFPGESWATLPMPILRLNTKASCPKK